MFSYLLNVRLHDLAFMICMIEYAICTHQVTMFQTIKLRFPIFMCIAECGRTQVFIKQLQNSSIGGLLLGDITGLSTVVEGTFNLVLLWLYQLIETTLAALVGARQDQGESVIKVELIVAILTIHE